MTNTQTTEYDYSATEPFLEPFESPIKDEPFIEDDEENYGKLWKFKQAVEFWTFGVNRQMDYVFLRTRMENAPLFLNWNTNEKVTLIEHHQKEYLVIVLQEVDNNGHPLKHNHSIIVKVGDRSGQFSIDHLLAFLPGTHMESLAEEFSKKFWPWRQTTISATVRKINLIFTNLDRYAVKSVEKINIGPQRRERIRRDSNAQDRSQSGTLPPASGGSAQGQARSNNQKRKEAESGPGEPSKKRGKSTLDKRPGTAGSSGSGLTTATGVQSVAQVSVPKHERFAEYQKDFWERHDSCYLFNKNTYEVSIDKCILANDEYIIRKLETRIVEDVKKELIQLGDVKQRQRVCLTPVDENRRLLKKAPEAWEDIQKGSFMIINGQHSIIASQQLQLGGCGAKRKKELATWEANIVWTLDQVKLTRISEFYNSTNHLNHAQPTWGNQIISCRNIWTSLKRPCNVANEAQTRNNGTIANLTQYSKFTSLIVSRFKNINPEKDGANVKGASDIKQEIRLITLPDDIFLLWQEFLNFHSEGKLIDPLTCKPFRDDSKFNSKSCTLKREFFRHMGHFTDEDFKAYANHLLGKTPGRTFRYPKVSVGKTRILVVDNQSGAEWVERRKQKKIIMDELIDIKTTLQFRNDRQDVIHDVWKAWKARHRFSSASWDFLISNLPKDYFKKRLTNEAKNKRAEDLTDKFPDIFPMFKTFMKLKYRLNDLCGGVQIQGQDGVSLGLVSSTPWKYVENTLNFGIMDARQAPRHRKTPVNKTAPLLPFLQFVSTHLKPKMSLPNVWLWILGDPYDTETITDFAVTEFKEFDAVISAYIPSKAERLNNVSSRTSAAQVSLLFLFKIGNAYADLVKSRMKVVYSTPEIPYYMESSMNTEAKWRIFPTELRMEFYLEILQNFTSPGENIVGIHTGAKCMLAAKMYGLYYYGIGNKAFTARYRDMADLADKLDMNDFLHANSPYLPNYIPPLNVPPPELNSGSSPTTDDKENVSSDSGEDGDQPLQSPDSRPAANQTPFGIDEFGTNRTGQRRKSSSNAAAAATDAGHHSSLHTDNVNVAGSSAGDVLYSEHVDLTESSSNSESDDDEEQNRKERRTKRKEDTSVDTNKWEKVLADSESRRVELKALKVKLANLEGKVGTQSDPRVEDKVEKDPPSVVDPTQPHPAAQVLSSSSPAEQLENDPPVVNLCLSPEIENTQDEQQDLRVEDIAGEGCSLSMERSVPEAQEHAIGTDTVVRTCQSPTDETEMQSDNPLPEEELLDYGEGEEDDDRNVGMFEGPLDAAEGRVNDCQEDETAEEGVANP